jgi:hypothetical protein
MLGPRFAGRSINLGGAIHSIYGRGEGEGRLFVPLGRKRLNPIVGVHMWSLDVVEPLDAVP